MGNTNGQIDNEVMIDIIEQSQKYANKYRIPRMPIAEKVQQEVSQLLAIGNFNVNDYSNQISNILNNLEDGPQIEQKRHQIKFKTNSFSFGDTDTNQTHDDEDDDENSDTSSDKENLEKNTKDQEVHQNENQENENNTERDETLTQGQETSDEEDESNNSDESNENNESNEDHNSSENVESNGTNDTNSKGDENTEDSKDNEEHTKTFSLKNVITTLSLVLAVVLGCKYGPQLWKFYKFKTAIPIECITKSSHQINYRQVNTDYYEDGELGEDCNHDMFFSWKKLRPHQLKTLQEKGITNIYLCYEVKDIPYKEFKPFKLCFFYSNFTNVQFIKDFKQYDFYQRYTEGFAATTEYLTALFNNKYIENITIYINSQNQFNALLPHLLKTTKRVTIFCQKHIAVTQTFNKHIYIYFLQ